MANPNIALSFKSPQFRSPLETAARAQQLAANAMTMQKTQREAASLNALRDYIGGGGTLDTPEAVSAAIQAGANPDTVRALAAQNLDVGKFQADRKKVATERLFNRLGAVDRAGENGDDQPWVDWITEYSALGPEEAAEAKAYLSITGGKYDPAIVKSLMAGSVEYFKKTTPQAATESLIGEGGEVGVLTRGGLAAPTIKTPRTLVPAPARAGTVTVEPSQTVEPGVGGPVNAAEVERFIQSFPAEAQAAIRARVNQGALGNIPMGSPVPAGLVAGERGGVGGPDEGYVEAPMPFRAKNPMQAPMPGSAIVPLPRLAGEKRVEAQAAKDVELAAEQTKKLAGKKQVSTILGKMRDAYEQLEKAEAIPSEKRGSFANVLDYLGSSTLGREAQKLVGTEESKYLSRIVNMRKALATAIKNATGMSAQEMNSNVELQLTLDTLTDPTQGIEAARMALADLEEIYGAPKEAAPAGPRRTPVTPNIPRAAIDYLRKNPSLSAAFDAKYGKGQAAKVLGRR